MFKIVLANNSTIELANATEQCSIEAGIHTLSLTIDDPNVSVVTLAKEVFTLENIKKMTLYSDKLKVGQYTEFTSVDNIRRDIEPSGKVALSVTFSRPL